MVRFLRTIARIPLQYSGAAYALVVAFATLWPEWSWDLGVPSLSWLSGLLLVGSASIVLYVVAFYRHEDILLSGVLLAAVTTAGMLAGGAIAATVRTKSFGPAILLAAMSPAVLFLRFLVLVPFYALLVWGGRRLRRYFAPDTLGAA